jgi:hypothetical protein
MFGYLLQEQIDNDVELFNRIRKRCLQDPEFPIKHKSGVHIEDLALIGAKLTHDKARDTVNSNFLLLLDFDLIRSSREIVHGFCVEHGFDEELAKTNEGRFSRVARNLVSHGDYAVLTRWPFRNKKGKITLREVSFEGQTIRHTDEGTPVYVDTVRTFKLHHALRAFVEQLPVSQ